MANVKTFLFQIFTFRFTAVDPPFTLPTMAATSGSKHPLVHHISDHMMQLQCLSIVPMVMKLKGSRLVDFLFLLHEA